MKYEKISQTTEKANREGYLIVVTLKKSADGTSYQVKASARDKKGNTVKNSTRSKYFAEAQQIESKTRQVIALVNAAIPKAASHTSRSAVFGLSENNPMVIAFHAVKNSEVNISSKWDAQYQRDRLSYFERHVLPHLQHYSDPDDAQALSAREHIYSIIIEDVRKNGNSKGHEPTMQTTARNHMAEADAIYRAMRREDPMLPDLDLGYARQKRIIQRETHKSLPDDIRKRFALALKEHVKNEPELVFGAVLMWDAGLRTAEAAAVIYNEDIYVTDDAKGTQSVCVQWQEKDGKMVLEGF